MSSVHTIPTTAVALACAPVHKRALGMAVGLVAGICVFVLTAFHIALQPIGEGLNVGLLAQYFYGFTVSWTGSAIGFGWAFLPGYSVTFPGSLIGFVYAFVVGYGCGRGVATIYNRLTEMTA